MPQAWGYVVIKCAEQPVSLVASKANFQLLMVESRIPAPGTFSQAILPACWSVQPKTHSCEKVKLLPSKPLDKFNHLSHFYYETTSLRLKPSTIRRLHQRALLWRGTCIGCATHSRSLVLTQWSSKTLTTRHINPTSSIYATEYQSWHMYSQHSCDTRPNHLGPRSTPAASTTYDCHGR